MNVLLNRTDFDQRWAASTLIDVIQEGMKVVILPFEHDEGWAFDRMDYEDRFQNESDYRYDLTRPFLAYGIQEEDMEILDFHTLSHEVVEKKINHADIVFLAGDNAEDMMNQLEDYEMVSLLKQYRGIVIGASAGALIQMESFPSEFEEGVYREGLGLVSGVDLEIHYEEDEFHLARILHSLETRYEQVLVLPEKGGILISGLNCEFMGSAALFDTTQLDEIYQAYRTYL